MSNNIPPEERIASSFKKLAVLSTRLDGAANELGDAVSKLETMLAKLKLGVAAWHTIASDAEENGDYWSRDIGYTLLGREWRIALRRTAGNRDLKEYTKEMWPFRDAPRWMCIESVAKIPDLVDDLIKRTDETIEKLIGRTREAYELADAINGVHDDLREK